MSFLSRVISRSKHSLGVWMLVLAHLVHAEAPRLDFELAGEHDFVRLSGLPAQTTIINFWRYDCPPCLREMPILSRLAKGGRIRVITVALHRPSETLQAPPEVLAALGSPLLTLYGPREPQGLLARFGDPGQALPHTVILNPERRLCAKKTGEISVEWLEKELASCKG